MPVDQIVATSQLNTKWKQLMTRLAVVLQKLMTRIVVMIVVTTVIVAVVMVFLSLPDLSQILRLFNQSNITHIFYPIFRPTLLNIVVLFGSRLRFNTKTSLE